jgi:hypothetical protein
MRTGRWGLWLLTLATVAAMTTGVNAVAAEHFETLATSASAPVKLGAGPVAVTLVPPASGKALSARIATVGQNRKVYLVAKGLGTDEPPETIYQIYLALPQGVAPDPAAIYYVGSLNFFNAVGVGRSDPRFLSFDVTALLKTLQSRNSLGDNTTVTIVPANTPRVSAKPVIGEVALVEQ